MNLAVGQVYAHVETGEEVVVIEVRDEDHPKGLGRGYGVSAIATPRGKGSIMTYISMHPFDTYILCGQLPNHGDERWQIVDDVHYEPNESTLAPALLLHAGPLPERP